MKRTLRLLLVEDDEAGRNAIRAAVATSEQDALLVEAQTVAAAEQALATQEFDCILIDATLPEGDPYLLLERASSTPAIMLTTHSERSAAKKALQRGAQDYLVRSTINAGMLMRSIRYAIERKRATELRLQLQHSDRLVSLGQLAAGVAHEINNPATYVSSNLEFLHQDLSQICGLISDLRAMAANETSPARQQALQQVLQRHDADRLERDLPTLLDENTAGLQRIVAIVKKLRSFSRVEVSTTDRIETCKLVESACQMVEHEIRHRARLRLDLVGAPVILGDRGELHQVLTNLLMNAAQAISEGEVSKSHEIRVTAQAQNGRARISVQDTGQGIPPHVLPKIFEPFFTTKKAQGTGLGLAICAEIAKKHGGSIEVQSEVGVGTTFTLVLPLADAELAVAAPVVPSPRQLEAETSDLAGHLPRLRLLLIDDEAMILKTYRRLLKDHDLTLVDSGQKAVDAIARNPSFDGILCDLMMPDLDGCAFYEHLEEVAPELLSRVVYCTGGAFTPRALEFVETLNAPLLEKPIGWTALQQIVGEWRRAQALRESRPPRSVPPIQLSAISKPGLEVRKS